MTQRLEPRFSSRLGASNNDLKALQEAARRRRSAREAGATAAKILAPFSAISTDSIQRLQQENRLKEFNAQLSQQRAAVTPQPTDETGTARPVSGLIGNLVSGLNVLQNITEGIGGFGSEAVQKIIPGEQDIEAKIAELRAQGVGPFKAREQAFEEKDMPSVRIDITPGFDIPLHGGRKLDEIDLGVKGAIEMVADPLNLALIVGTFGVGAVPAIAAKQSIRAALMAAVRTQGVPGTAKWIRTAKQASAADSQQMVRIVRRIEDEVPAPGSGVLTVPEAPKGSAYQRFLQAEETFVPTKKPSVGARVGEKKAWLAEQITDEFDQVNASSARVKNELADIGLPYADSINAELHSALLKGAISAGVSKAQTVVRLATRTLGKGIDRKHLSAYLRLRHALDVQAMPIHEGRRDTRIY